MRLEARLLLGRAAGLSTERLVGVGREPAPASVAEALRGLLARRVRREPMAHILGEREFWGLPFHVSPAILTPRPDSETVIEAALAVLTDRDRPWRLLDLGIGSGCLLLTLLRELPAAIGVGVDASCDALAIAQANATRLEVAGRATLRQADWRQESWATTLGGPFDLIVSNPPYIQTDAIEGLMPEVARYEPRLALDGGADGLDAYRSIAAGAPFLLAPGGRLIVEVGFGQAEAVAAMFDASGFAVAPPWRDLGGVERAISMVRN